MIQRNITQNTLDALADTPVVLINGARQTGKSTLVQSIVEQAHPARYITLDTASVLAAVRNDPTGFLAGIDGAVVIDEVQKAPELFAAIKADVDRRTFTGASKFCGAIPHTGHATEHAQALHDPAHSDIPCPTPARMVRKPDEKAGKNTQNCHG